MFRVLERWIKHNDTIKLTGCELQFSSFRFKHRPGVHPWYRSLSLDYQSFSSYIWKDTFCANCGRRTIDIIHGLYQLIVERWIISTVLFDVMHWVHDERMQIRRLGRYVRRWWQIDCIGWIVVILFQSRMTIIGIFWVFFVLTEKWIITVTEFKFSL